MQEAWKEQEKVVNELKAENDRLKNGFDDAWYEEAQSALKTSKNVTETLRALIKKAHETDRSKPATSISNAKETGADELAAITSVVAASTAPSGGSKKMF